MNTNLLLVALLFWGTCAQAAPGYYRDPDLLGDRLVFSSEGDLWLSSAAGGKTQRLTTHPAEESQPRISPDGTHVAFAANYGERPQVYVMPLAGGVAKQVTFENGRIKVQGWTENGEILYSTDGRLGPIFSYNLRKVDPNSLKAESIPLADAVEGVADDRGQYLYFVQFGMQVSRDNLRQYKGGAKGILWRYRLGSKREAQRLLDNHNGSIRRPMLDGNSLYFISDASGADNLWVVDVSGGKPQQLTQHNEWSVRGASADEGRLVYQLGADIRMLDVANGNDSVLKFNLTSDLPHLRERWLNTPLKHATSYSLNASGDRLALTARGRVALANTDKQRLVEASTPTDSRTRKATLSPDGEWIYALNDQAGEIEIWRFAADGSDRSEQLTRDGSSLRLNLSLSPDGQWLAHDDNDGNLWILNTQDLKNRRIMKSADTFVPFNALVWSQDSSLLAISRAMPDQSRSQLFLYSLERDKYEVLTTGKYNSGSPAFSVDGEWLYFLSEREFNAFPGSPWGDRNMGSAFDRRTQIFALALQENARFPFGDPTELDTPEKDQDADNAADSDENKSKDSTNIQVDWQGLKERLWMVPVPADNYQNLAASEQYLYASTLDRKPKAVPALLSIKIEANTQPEVFSENVEEFQLSNDGKKVFVRLKDNNNGKLYIVDSGKKFPTDTKGHQVQTNAWRLRLDPAHEWRQMFKDAWLMHRDQFFDPNMRGIDWASLKEKYWPLLERIRNRHELDDVFAQMMGELGALHSQVGYGEYPLNPDAPKQASLGALFKQVDEHLIIESIFRHEAELPHKAPPLAAPGVDAKAGDRILSLNGQSVSDLATLGSLLQNQAGQQVLLELQRNQQTHKVVVTASSAANERRARYTDWVMRNSEKVAAKRDDIGYLHMFTMTSRDVGHFAREFYALNEKPGLIIDVRRNGGGNIDSLIIEKLMRRAWSFWQSRDGSAPRSNQQGAYRGHLVILADQFTYSDGETFAAAIKALELAPVIGKQTAGAGVWLTGRNTLVDKGRARVAELPVYAMDGRWINEGHGVTPTIEVDNLPHAAFNGEDAQLAAAIKLLARRIKEQPVPSMNARPFPSGTSAADDVLAN